MHGDVMQSMERKTEALKTEVERLSALLRKPKGLTLHDELQRKRKGVRDEIELNSRRMEEFRSAMKCVLRYIEGNNWEDSSFIHEFVVFQFRDGLDWSRIHHIVMRECRRLDDGLPIYGFRVDILHKLLSEQVYISLHFWFYGGNNCIG